MATLRSVELAEDGENIEYATIRMTLPELVMLAKLVGRMSGDATAEVWPHPLAATAVRDLFSATAGALNAFYEDGVDDAARSL